MRRCQRPYDADKFVRICRLLRVLNALRLMGIPLTFTQLEELSPASIVDRLVVLGHWPMAVKLCEFLEINSKEGVYKVIAHWCLAMMTTFKEQNRFGKYLFLKKYFGFCRVYSSYKVVYLVLGPIELYPHRPSNGVRKFYLFLPSLNRIFLLTFSNGRH